MKSSISQQNRTNRGSVLLIVMGIVVVVGIALASVLGLTLHEQRIMARTSAWNAALPAAEAGIEEAMSHLRQVDGGPRGANGWKGYGTSFLKTNTLDNSRYVVGISSATPPTIISIGQVWSSSAGRYIERRIQVTTKGQGTFQKGLMAQDKISMSGQFSIDSFDSSNPAYSTDGGYDAAKRKDNGDVGTMRNSSDAMTMSGQVNIYGRVATGPAGNIQQSGQVSVGTTNWIDGGNNGIQSGRYTKDVNVSFPIATVPYTNSGATPSGGKVGSVTYTYILDTGDYRLSTISLSGKNKMLIRGDARLVVDQDVNLSGQAFIQINTNASLQLYVKKGSVSLSGQGVANLTDNATKFSLFGLPEMKNVNLSGNGGFIGTIYAPQAKLNMSGGGNDELDFIGAAIVNEISGSGHFKVHYDEALGSGGARNLIVASWKEI